MKDSTFSLFMETIKTVENYRNSTFVIKASEDILNSKSSITAFVESVSLFLHAGIRVVIMHDGFNASWNLMDRMGFKGEFNGKYRLVDSTTVEILEMAMSGTVNKKLTSVLSEFGIKALGLSGRDSSLFTARKMYALENGAQVDTGFVGEIDRLNKKLIKDLLNIGCVPVISPIACDNSGNTYILEPIYAAQKISSALMAEKLIVLNGDKESTGKSFFEKGCSSKYYDEDLDCVYNQGKSDRGFEAKYMEDEIKSVYIIDIENISSMIQEIFSDKKRNIS